MASQPRQDRTDLIQHLEKEPYRYDLFHVLRVLESVHQDKPRLGTSARVKEDFIRFSQEPGLGFAASIIAAYEDRGPGRPGKMTVKYPGLFGANGPLPHHITEYIRDRDKNHDDGTLRSFLDLFNHRTISLLYRAWASVRRHVSCDRESEDRFRLYLSSLIGWSSRTGPMMEDIPVNARLYYSGILAGQTNPADGLQVILSGFFGHPVVIEEFVGDWIQLPNQFFCRLGEQSDNARLGAAVAGTSTWSVDQKFRIVIGPISIREYKDMLPSSKSFKRMVSWVKHYVVDSLAWDVVFKIEDRNFPFTRLDGRTALGWTSWLRSEKPMNSATVCIGGA